MTDLWKDVRDQVKEGRATASALNWDGFAEQISFVALEEILADADALLAVVKAAQWQPDIPLMQKAVKWSKANYRHIGDYPTVNWGAREYIQGCRRVRIDEALAALPEHLK